MTAKAFVAENSQKKIIYQRIGLITDLLITNPRFVKVNTNCLDSHLYNEFHSCDRALGSSSLE